MEHHQGPRRVAVGAAVALSLTFLPRSAVAQLQSNVAGDDWSLPAGTPRAPDSGLYWISQSDAATLSKGHQTPRYAVNIPVTWSTVEPSDGVFDWSSVDKIVNAVHAMGPGAGFGLWPWYGSKSEIPAWVQSKYNLVFGSNGRDAPWASGDQWETAVKPFIQAMAARYGSDPQLVYVDMRTPFDQSGEFTLPTNDVSLAPAIETWQDAFVDDYTGAFAGHTHKLVNMISGAGAFYIDPTWKTTFEAMINYSYKKGTGERDGFPTETKIWHAGFGHLVDADGYLTFDVKHLPFVNGAFSGSEATEFDPTSNRFGPAADTAYRYRLAILWNLLTRRNWLVMALYNTPGYGAFSHWAEMELGQHAATAPDAWSWPKSSTYGNFDIDSTSPVTIKNFERWLMQRDVAPDGMTQPTDQQADGMFGRGGIESGSEYGARRTDHASGNDNMYFRVDRAFWSGGPHSAWIKVTYLDDCASGAWHLEYSSPTKADTASQGVDYTGSGGWKTATFLVDDLDLAGSFAGGMDFRLVDSGSCDLTVDFARLIRKPSATTQAGGLEAPRTPSPITVDGDLQEFAGATPLTFSDHSVSDNTVSARALWDGANLDLAFAVTDANVETAPATRDGNVWSHDGIEFFLDVDDNGGPTMETDDYHFIVDANGVVWDGRGTGVAGNNGDVSWNSHIIASATKTATGYNVEVSLPWSDVGATPAAGLKLGLLLVNNDLDKGNLSYFSDKGGTPWQVPSQWGTLTLLGTPPGGDGGVADGGPVDGGSVDGGSVDGGANVGKGSGGGCGCRVGAGSSPTGTGGWALVLVAVPFALRRRRR